MGRDSGTYAGALSIELMSLGLIGCHIFSLWPAAQMYSDDEVHHQTPILRRAVAPKCCKTKHNHRSRWCTPQLGARV